MTPDRDRRYRSTRRIEEIESRLLNDRALAIDAARALLDANGEATVSEVAELLVESGLSWPGVLSPFRRNDRATRLSVKILARRALVELEETGSWTSQIEHRDGVQIRVWSEVP